MQTNENQEEIAFAKKMIFFTPIVLILFSSLTLFISGFLPTFVVWLNPISWKNLDDQLLVYIEILGVYIFNIKAGLNLYNSFQENDLKNDITFSGRIFEFLIGSIILESLIAYQTYIKAQKEYNWLKTITGSFGTQISFTFGTGLVCLLLSVMILTATFCFILKSNRIRDRLISHECFR